MSIDHIIKSWVWDAMRRNSNLYEKWTDRQIAADLNVMHKDLTFCPLETIERHVAAYRASIKVVSR